MRSDNDLMRAHAEGDPDAFDELFRRHARSVHGFMRKDLWRPEAAHDLTQQTFLQLHRSRFDFKPSGNLRGWLMTIARNLKYDYMRQVQRRPKTVRIEDSEPVGGGEDDARVEARDTLERALESLPANQRDVVRLFWFEHLPYAVIAERLGASEAAVRVRAHRAYKALRERIDAMEGEE